jgi:hypothetical protein
MLTSSNAERNQIRDEDFSQGKNSTTADTLNGSPDKAGKLAGNFEIR